MQLIIEHELTEELILPINYQRILQSIIYHGIELFPAYSEYIHEAGYGYGDRKYRMFTFGLLKGKYRIENGKIIFMDSVSFEVRSPEILLLKLLKESLRMKGIRYGKQWYGNVKTTLKDETVEQEEIYIQMKTPIVVYETDHESRKTYFFQPDEEGFYYGIQDNFVRKYHAYTGIEIMGDIEIYPAKITAKDKCVTKYKEFYINGWLGEYILRGERKYLDFLYQSGIGSKNAQGFGMFDIVGGQIFHEDDTFY